MNISSSSIGSTSSTTSSSVTVTKITVPVENNPTTTRTSSAYSSENNVTTPSSSPSTTVTTALPVSREARMSDADNVVRLRRSSVSSEGTEPSFSYMNSPGLASTDLDFPSSEYPHCMKIVQLSRIVIMDLFFHTPPSTQQRDKITCCWIFGYDKCFCKCCNWSFSHESWAMAWRSNTLVWRSRDICSQPNGRFKCHLWSGQTTNHFTKHGYWCWYKNDKLNDYTFEC